MLGSAYASVVVVVVDVAEPWHGSVVLGPAYLKASL